MHAMTLSMVPELRTEQARLGPCSLCGDEHDLRALHAGRCSCCDVLGPQAQRLINSVNAIAGTDDDERELWLGRVQEWIGLAREVRGELP